MFGFTLGKDSGGERRFLLRAWPVDRQTVMNLWFSAKLHSVLIAASILVIAVLHYLDGFPFSPGPSAPDMDLDGMHRVLFMAPTLYAGFVFGPLLGYAVLVLVTVIMLPKAVFEPSAPVDAILEVLVVVLVSSLVLLWFKGQLSERRRRLEVNDRLTWATQELASQVEVIRSSERHLATLNDICHTVTQSLDLPVVLHKILEKVSREMGCEAAMIYLLSASADTFELVDHLGISERLAASIALMGAEEKIISSGQMKSEEQDAESYDGGLRTFSAALIEEGFRSQLAVPILSKERSVGILCLAAQADHRFSTEERALVTAIGSQAGIAIENARLYQDMRFSEEKHRDLFENATVAILLHDLEGIVVDANKACETLTGFARSELTGIKLSELLLPGSQKVIATVQEALLAGDPTDQPYEVRMSRRGAGDAILSLTTRLVTREGRPMGFQHIALDITERRQMQESLAYYMRETLTAQEEERKRIARDLHDGAVQSLLVILQRMEALGSDRRAGLSMAAKREMESLRSYVLDTLAEIRQLTKDLRPHILDDLGLVAAVQWLAEETEGQGGTRTRITVNGVPRRLSPEVQLLLFRIAQEALSNVRKHSSATAARISLEFRAEETTMIVQDDGCGFVVPRSLTEMAEDGKLGLLGMSERARLAGGSLIIESSPGNGTRVTARLPT